MKVGCSPHLEQDGQVGFWRSFFHAAQNAGISFEASQNPVIDAADSSSMDAAAQELLVTGDEVFVAVRLQHRNRRRAVSNIEIERGFNMGGPATGC